MFRKEIKFIYDFNLNKVRKLGAYLTYEQIRKADIHPAILQYISAEIDYLIFEDRQKILKDSIFDYSGEKISAYFNQIGDEVKKNKRFSIEYIAQLILHSSSFTVNYLARPRWALMKLIFEDDEHKSTTEIKQILNYVYYYGYLKKIITSYINRKKILSINYNEFDDLLNKIDNLGFQSDFHVILESALQSMADFFNIGETHKKLIPLQSVELFLREKNLQTHLLKLREEFPQDEKLIFDLNDYKKAFGSIRPVEKEDFDDIESEIVEDESISTESEEEIYEEEIKVETSPEVEEGLKIKFGEQDEEIKGEDNGTVEMNGEPKADDEAEIPDTEPQIEDEEIKPAEGEQDKASWEDEIPADEEEALIAPEVEIDEDDINELVDDKIPQTENEPEIESEEDKAEQIDQPLPVEPEEDVTVSDEVLIPGLNDELLSETSEEVIEEKLDEEEHEIITEEKEETTEFQEILIDEEEESDDDLILVEESESITSPGPDEDVIIEEISEPTDTDAGELEEEIESSDEDKEPTEADVEQPDDATDLTEDEIIPDKEPVDEEEIKFELDEEAEALIYDPVFEDKTDDEETDREESVIDEEKPDETTDDSEALQEETKTVESLDDEPTLFEAIDEIENKLLIEDTPAPENETDGAAEDLSIDESKVDEDEIKILDEESSPLEEDVDEEEAAEESVQDSDKTKIEISELLERKNMTKVIEVIFDYDIEEFAYVIDSACTSETERDAMKILDKLFKNNRVGPTSKEAETLKSIISDFFNQKEK